ncbi:Ig-like domain-containing protein, partial [Escherichia coli]
MTLNKTALTLEVGATETLTATVSPENAADKSVQF